jgi:hypothetical protein
MERKTPVNGANAGNDRIGMKKQEEEREKRPSKKSTANVPDTGGTPATNAGDCHSRPQALAGAKCPVLGNDSPRICILGTIG